MHQKVLILFWLAMNKDFSFFFDKNVYVYTCIFLKFKEDNQLDLFISLVFDWTYLRGMLTVEN